MVTQAEKIRRWQEQVRRRRQRMQAGLGNARPLAPARPGHEKRYREMIIGVMAVSSFTASVVATLTLNRLAAPVPGVQSLRTMRVGTVAPSTSADYLRSIGIKPILFSHVRPALRALKDGKIQAMVYDAPILRYFMRGRLAADIRILPKLVQRQYYAFALPDGSPLRRAISDALLEEINSAPWHRLKERYLGPQP